MDSWAATANNKHHRTSSVLLTRRPYADEEDVVINDLTNKNGTINGYTTAHRNTIAPKQQSPSNKNRKAQLSPSFSQIPPASPLSGRTVSRTNRLRQQGLSVSFAEQKNIFAVRSIRRGSDDWQRLLQPFVSDLAFRSVVQARPFQSKPTFQPYTCSQAAVLFVDLSSYSKITAALAHKGAHYLSNCVNQYLQRILNIVKQWGGDVVKFAGDAILVVWVGREREQHTNNDLLSSPQSAIHVYCAAQCAMELQTKAAVYPIKGTDLAFRMHCGLSCGPLESDIFEAPTIANMQRLYHSVGGEALYEISELVDLAKAGEVCISLAAAELLGDKGSYQDLGNGELEIHTNDSDNYSSEDDAEDDSTAALGKLLTAVSFDESDLEAMETRITASLSERLFRSSKKLEEDFIHPSVLGLLSHGGMSPTQIAQMRNLCVLFIGMTTTGNSVNWLMEVQGVLDQCRCPIVQIIDDDKGVHIVAAVNLYETVPEASLFGLDVCQRLVEKRVGCAIGVAMGPTFCGVTGCSTVACRWDITGPPAVRAARLMQYALMEQQQNDDEQGSSGGKKFAVAVDESVYGSGPTVSIRLDVYKSGVAIKGASQPITVYTLSQSTVQSAFRLLETVHAHVHNGPVQEIQDYIAGRPRSAVVVAGIPLAGKKIVCQRAAGHADLVPFLHVADATNGLLQLARTIATWFRYAENEPVRQLAESVLELLGKNQWSWAHEECIRLVDLALSEGLRACILVDRVHFLDEFSLSLMRECLRPSRRRQRRLLNRVLSSHVSEYDSSSHHGGSSAPFPSEEMELAGPGRICFLCVHVTLYNHKTAEQLVQEIVRSHTSFRVPIVQVLEATRDELRAAFQELADVGVDERWLDIYAESAGYCVGYLIERGAANRKRAAKLWAQGKTAHVQISQTLAMTVPCGRARENRLLPLNIVSLDVAMRFQLIYDELPPLFQTLTKILAAATGKHLCRLPRFVAWEVLNDLIAEGVESDTFVTVLEEMVEMFILKEEQPSVGPSVLSFRTPAISDIAMDICTPIQLKAIRRALLGRLEPIQTSNFQIPLLMADLYHDLGEKEETKRALWRNAFELFQVQSQDFTDERDYCRWKEIILDEILASGYSVAEVLNEDFCTACKPQPQFLHFLLLLKSYMGPVALGPMGHTINVMTRNIFHEWSAFHGADTKVVEEQQAQTKSAAARYYKEMDIIEDLLKEKGLPADLEDLEEERGIIGMLATPAQSEEDVKSKTLRFHDDFVPLIEGRLQRLHQLVEIVRADKEIIPAFVKKSEDALRKAYMYLACSSRSAQGICRQDAAQHALMILATMNWKPRPVPEFLHMLQHQTVARLRNRTLKRESDGELVMFRHRQTIVDLEAFLLVTSLLYVAQDEGRC